MKINHDLTVTVQDLIDLLKDFPQDAVIVLSKDGEGNVYSPLSIISSGRYYVPENERSGEVYQLNEIHPDEDSVPAVVLFPTA